MVTEYHKFFWQLKNAESILEYERMAEIGFEKRDFRMVSYSLDTVLVVFLFCFVCVCVICEVYYVINTYQVKHNILQVSACV